MPLLMVRICDSPRLCWRAALWPSLARFVLALDHTDDPRQRKERSRDSGMFMCREGERKGV